MGNINKWACHIVGSITKDTNVVDGNKFKKIGGVPAYAGGTYLKKNCNIVAHSSFSNKDILFLGHTRAQFQLTPSKKTTFFINDYSEKQRRQFLIEKGSSIQFKIKDENKIDLIHLGPLFPKDISLLSLKKIKGIDVPKAVDIQGYTRTIDKSKRVISEVSGKHIRIVFEICDYVKMSIREKNLVEKVLGDSIESILDKHAIKEIIVTQGSDGGYVISKKQRVPFATKKVPISDSTGAGDVFFASYLFNRVLLGKKIKEAAFLASDDSADHVSGNFLKQDHCFCKFK